MYNIVFILCFFQLKTFQMHKIKGSATITNYISQCVTFLTKKRPKICINYMYVLTKEFPGASHCWIELTVFLATGPYVQMSATVETGVFQYPRHLIDSAIKHFIDSKVILQTQFVSSASQEVIEIIRITLLFKDQKSANSVKQQLCKLSCRINIKIKPVFLSCKIQEDLKVTECKPRIVNQQCVLYKLKCNLCDYLT